MHQCRFELVVSNLLSRIRSQIHETHNMRVCDAEAKRQNKINHSMQVLVIACGAKWKRSAHQSEVIEKEFTELNRYL